ncbi:MAG: hypothetical protein ABJI95_21015 [Paracoccaceae bacterium]
MPERSAGHAAAELRNPFIAKETRQIEQAQSKRLTRAQSLQIKIGDGHASAVLELLKGTSQDTYNTYLQATPDYAVDVQASSPKPIADRPSTH